MRRTGFRSLVSNESGASLVIILLAAATLGLVTVLAVEIGAGFMRDSRESRTLENINGLEQSVKVLLKNPNVCKDGVDGPAGAQPGLQFEDISGSPSPFNAASAMGADGQNVRFGTNFRALSGSLVTLRGGTALSEFEMIVERLYVKAVPRGTTFGGQLIVRMRPSAGTGVQLNDRVLANIVFAVDASGMVTSCGLDEFQPTAQQLCQSIGCNFDPDSANQICLCPLPTMSCPHGQYIAGFHPLTLAPACKTLEVQCVSGYLLGIMPDGTAACGSVTAL